MTKLGLLALFTLALSTALAAQPLERELEAPGPEGPLKGTLLLPDGEPDWAVLIIPGSGSIDRDGNNEYGLETNLYKLLAEGLASNGIASLRIDKRGMFASQAAIADANDVTVKDYADDLAAWVAVLREAVNAKCVWLLGHSEGALIASVAAGNNLAICGLLLVGAPGRPLGTVMREQFAAYLAGKPELEDVHLVIDAMEAGKRFDVSNRSAVVQGVFRPEAQGYIIDLFSYNPAATLAGYPGPVLVLQGDRDLQVSEADAALLASAHAGARLVLLPNTNHLLKEIETDDRAANLESYSDPQLPLAPGAIDALTDFIHSGH